MRVPARFDRRTALLWAVAIIAALALAWWDFTGGHEPEPAEPAPAPAKPARQDVEIVTGGGSGDGGAADSAADPAPDAGKAPADGGGP